MDTQRAYEETEECEETVPNHLHKKMTKKELEELFRVIEEFEGKCLEADPDEDRIRRICRKSRDMKKNPQSRMEEALEKRKFY